MRTKALLNIFIAIFIMPLCLMACNSVVSNDNSRPVSESVVSKQNINNKEFIVAVFGAIHGGHRTSERYSLPILETAIRKYEPDVIFIEIPPSSMAQAQSSFDQFGEVRERRTRAFPELTDVVFPLKKELGFELVATAGWSRQLANNRAAVLKRIENDSSRQSQWQEHISARNNLFKIQRQNRNNPLYIHTDQYDEEVKAAQTPYEKYFDADIGAGGWGPINEAHVGLMNDALDHLKSEKKTSGVDPVRVLIVFGAWHKYKILEAMKLRDDVALIDARQFFQ